MWLYLGLLIFVLVVWAWSTGWRTYFVEEDIPNLVLVILFFTFIGWLGAKPKSLYGP